MYLAHFGLKVKPFDLTPDPEFIHFSAKHKLAYSLLEYGIFEQSGITVITGEIGSGKTTLISLLMRNIAKQPYTVGLINHTHRDFGDLLTCIALTFGIPYKERDKAEIFRTIQNYVIGEYAKGRRVLLVVDEAQNMDDVTLEELRLFTNINTAETCLFQIVLVGQPELQDRLSQANMAQIAQRVSVEYHLAPLNWRETSEYIFHRLSISGCKRPLFDEGAIAVIFYHSAGIPRLINTLCDYALVFAYAKGKSTIDIDTALEVIKGRKIGGTNRFNKIREETERIRRIILESTDKDIAKIS